MRVGRRLFPSTGDVRIANTKFDLMLTLCSNSRSVPSSFKRYVRKKPLVQVRGVRCVSAAVPTTRVSSPFRTDHGTKATEKAASLLSRWITLTVSFCNGGRQFLDSKGPRVKYPANLVWVYYPNTRSPGAFRRFGSPKLFRRELEHLFIHLLVTRFLEMHPIRLL